MKRQGFAVWLTGLPSSGKSTLARLLQAALEEAGLASQVLDGDEVRERLTKGLGFTKKDRDENIRRISYVARLLTKVGGVAITAAISPYRESRDRARAEIGSFVEVYVNTPVAECEKRDVKGLYKKARSGEIKEFTGVSDPYEVPENPEVVCDTLNETEEQSAEKVISRLVELGYLKRE